MRSVHGKRCIRFAHIFAAALLLAPVASYAGGARSVSSFKNKAAMRRAVTAMFVALPGNGCLRGIGQNKASPYRTATGGGGGGRSTTQKPPLVSAVTWTKGGTMDIWRVPGTEGNVFVVSGLLRNAGSNRANEQYVAVVKRSENRQGWETLASVRRGANIAGGSSAKVIRETTKNHFWSKRGPVSAANRAEALNQLGTLNSALLHSSGGPPDMEKQANAVKIMSFQLVKGLFGGG